MSLCYGVATMSRMLKNIGLFCKRDLQKRYPMVASTCVTDCAHHFENANTNECIHMYMT